ncbi:hypothetical protein V1502_16930 [Bacillus sp. SCS-153A]|uniref:hypothetical protein n=1 Tax=Rossellomorea sedimentorum TaxID=3115294 RepID=UPI00390686B8
MKTAKRIILGIIGAGIAAGFLGGVVVTADQSESETRVEAEDTSASPLYVPADGEGHTWVYVKTRYTSSGYIKLYSDSDTYWYYTKEVYYDQKGEYLKTVYDKFAK